MTATDTSSGWLPSEGRMWLAATSILFVAGWIKGINLLMLLAYLMLALMLLNFVVAFRQLRRVRARRVPGGPLFAGRPGFWEVELTGGTRPSSGWQIEDRGPNHRNDWFQDRLGARQTIRIRSEAILPRRGSYAPAPLSAPVFTRSV